MSYKVGHLFVGLVLVVGFVCLAGDVRAENVAVPAAINYQGMLTNPSDGNPVQAGVYHLEFRVWNDPVDTAEANLIWGRVFSVHVMESGVFNILLTDDGTEVTAPAAQTNDIRQAFQGENRYLGLTITHGPMGVINSPEISPRQRMVSSPFAFHAQNATDAYHAEHADEAVLAQNSEKLGGKDAGRFYNEDERIHTDHGLTVLNATITPSIGHSAGVRFPNNIGGGTGDTAGLSYAFENAEDCELRLYVGNDAEDKIRIEASGNIEINAGESLVLKNSENVEIIHSRAGGYEMDRWYTATGDGMVTFHGYKGHMFYYHQRADDSWITYSTGWHHYFHIANADTLTFTMPVAKGDKIKFDHATDMPDNYKITWTAFGNSTLE